MADEIIIIGFQDDAFTSPTCNRVRSLIIRWYAFACNFDIMQTQQTPLFFECKRRFEFQSNRRIATMFLRFPNLKITTYTHKS